MVRIALSLAILGLASGEAAAQAAAARKAAREVVEFCKKRFAREVVEEGAEKLESRFAWAINSYGDDVAKAARRLGPKIVLSNVERHGAGAARLLGRYGDDGARLLSTDAPAALRVFNDLGEPGIDLMIRRRGAITGARLPDLAPAIKASGRPREILAVLEKYGDRACAFLWRNKGVIFGGAALAAFLVNPAPYIEGIKELAEVPVGHIAAGTDWTAVFLVMIVLATGLAAFRMLVLRRPAPRSA